MSQYGNSMRGDRSTFGRSPSQHRAPSQLTGPQVTLSEIGRRSSSQPPGSRVSHASRSGLSGPPISLSNVGSNRGNDSRSAYGHAQQRSGSRIGPPMSRASQQARDLGGGNINANRTSSQVSRASRDLRGGAAGYNHPERPPSVPNHSVLGGSGIGRYQQELNTYRREPSAPASRVSRQHADRTGSQGGQGLPRRSASAVGSNRVSLPTEHISASQVSARREQAAQRNSRPGSQVTARASQAGRQSQLGGQSQNGQDFNDKQIVPYDRSLAPQPQGPQSQVGSAGNLGVEDEIKRRRIAGVSGSLKRQIDDCKWALSEAEKTIHIMSPYSYMARRARQVRAQTLDDIDFCSQRLKEYNDTLDLYDRAAGRPLPRDTSRNAVGAYDSGASQQLRSDLQRSRYLNTAGRVVPCCYF